MLKTQCIIVVEGKYDKAHLENILDAVIIETDGFAVFKDKEKIALLKKLSEKHEIVILTDSDRAGFKIRGFLSGALPGAKITHIYIPRTEGRERRKTKPGAQGLLGVEGIKKETLEQCLIKSGIFSGSPRHKPFLTVQKIYEIGLTGGKNSAAKRRELLLSLDLPPGLSVKRMLEVINRIYTKEQFEEALGKITG